MDNNTVYPSNSDNRPPESQQHYEKRVQKPTQLSGGVQTQEKSKWDEIREFFSLGEANDFRGYVSLLSEITNRVYSAIDTLLGNKKPQQPYVPGARTAYTSYYAQQNQTQQTQTAPQNSSLGAYIHPNILFDLYEDAERVLFDMIGMLGVYTNVSVGDMYDFAGLTSPNGYTDFRYGWKSLNGVTVIPCGSKYMINLPPTVQLK